MYDKAQVKDTLDQFYAFVFEDEDEDGICRCVSSYTMKVFGKYFDSLYKELDLGEPPEID